MRKKNHRIFLAIVRSIRRRDVVFSFFLLFYSVCDRDDTTSTRVCSIAIDTFWLFPLPAGGDVHVLDDGSGRREPRRKVSCASWSHGTRGLTGRCRLLHPKELEMNHPCSNRSSHVNKLFAETDDAGCL